MYYYYYYYYYYRVLALNVDLRTGPVYVVYSPLTRHPLSFVSNLSTSRTKSSASTK